MFVLDVNGTLPPWAASHSFINQIVVVSVGIDGRKMLNPMDFKTNILFIWDLVEHIAVVQVVVEDLD